MTAVILANTAIEYVEQAPAGWHVLIVLRERSRKWDWVALLADVVHPDEHGLCPTVVVRVPGKHRNKAAAEAALQDMLATRH